MTETDVRECKQCKEVKPVSEFYRANGGRTRFTECKVCNRSRARQWQRDRRVADPTYSRRSNLSRYGITPERYDALLKGQGGRCATCPAIEPGGRGKHFHVDHDHTTGLVRGLLCHGCNTAIGLLGEDPKRLVALADYLLRQRDVLVTF